jgi:hypothetical protein
MVAPHAFTQGDGLLVAVAVVATLLTAGLYFFRRMEHSFADVV